MGPEGSFYGVQRIALATLLLFLPLQASPTPSMISPTHEGDIVGSQGRLIRALSSALIVSVIGVVTANPQEPSAVPPYEEPDAYQIYSLLLPKQQSYGFAKGTLRIQEETESNAAVDEACLSRDVAKQFKDAISDYERSRTTTYLLKRHFQIEKPYEVVNKETLTHWDDNRYRQSGGYVFMSAVGFNKKKTQAIVYMGSICGGLCGSSSFHLLEKVNGQWKQVPGVKCVTVS